MLERIASDVNASCTLLSCRNCGCDRIWNDFVAETFCAAIPSVCAANCVSVFTRNVWMPPLIATYVGAERLPRAIDHAICEYLSSLGLVPAGLATPSIRRSPGLSFMPAGSAVTTPKLREPR